MKKLALFFLILTTVLALCACGKDVGSEGQQPAAKQQVATEKDKSKQESKSQAAGFEKIVQGDSYLLNYQGTVTIEGQSIETDVTFATNGKDTSIQNKMGDVTAHILVKDGVTYQIDDSRKTYTAIYEAKGKENEADGTEDVLASAKQEPSDTGTAEVFGKQLPYKEYTDGDEITRFYTDGDQLYAVSVKSPDHESLLRVLELTDEVPASMLELPSGYTEAKISQ